MDKPSGKKARSCCTKSLSWRRVKIFVVDIIKWDRLLSPCFCIACEAWSTLRDHVFVGIIVLPIVTHWLPIDNPWRDASISFKLHRRVKHHKIQVNLEKGGNLQIFYWVMAHFSSPEGKAQGELLWSVFVRCQ